MSTDNRTPVRRQDYSPPAYLVDSIHLDVDIRPDGTRVTATAAMARNPDATGTPILVLDGEGLETLSVRIDGRLLSASEYTLAPEQLTLRALPERFVLETRVRIQPDSNTRLSGLYRSRDGYFTQCEAEGFRRITWFHRPAGRDGALHRHPACRPRALSGAAGQRQPGRQRRRGRRPPLGDLGRSLSRSPAICSPWWPASSMCSRQLRHRAPGARCSLPSMSNRASSTSAATPWRR